MKKLLTVIILSLILILPTNVSAAAKEYSIDNLNIDAVILENGDIEINEIIEYNFSGDFNGVFRDIDTNGSNGVEINEVSIINANGESTIAIEGYSQENNTYEINNMGSYTQIKLFNKNNNENKKFNFKYTIKGAAQKYSDYSEVYWNFYTVQNVPVISKGTLSISLKDTAFNPDNFFYKLYGDGEITSTNSDTTISVDFNNLTSLIGVEMRFQRDYLALINESTYVPDTNYNEGQYNGGNESYTTTSSEQTYAPLFFMLFVALGVGGAFVIHTKNQKAIQKYRDNFIFENSYIVTEPPADLSPALVNLLINEKVVNESMINPSLFYLVNKGYYSVEERKEYINKKGKKVQKDDLVFTRLDKSTTLQYSHLNFLLDWFEKYEKDNVFSLQGIKESVKSSSKGQDFINDLTHWKTLVRKDAENLEFFTKVGMSTILENSWYNEKNKWLQYKNYITNLVSNNVDDIENFISDSIIYAYALEVSNDVLKNIIDIASIKANSNNNCNSDYYNNTYLYNTYYLNNYFYYTTLFNDINGNAHDAARPPDNSSTSSFDFGSVSSGSDFSGGGGGGSGAF